MKKIHLLLLFFLAVNYCVVSEEIDFPPELVWWMDKIKTVNNTVAVNNFTLLGQEKRIYKLNVLSSQFLMYPVFMRWNFSGNCIAYYDYNGITLQRQQNGKYRIYSGDIDSGFVLADRNKNIFFVDSFGSTSGIDAYNWLTDTILVAVGSWVNMDGKMDLFIKIYTINNPNSTIEIKTYIYNNAITVEARNNLRLKWFEQRLDYFEPGKN